MKKTDIYKLEIRCLGLIALAIILSVITSIAIFIVYEIVLNVFVLNNKNLNDLVYYLRTIFSFGEIKIIIEIIIFLIYLHRIFYNRIKYFVEIDLLVDSMADGNFHERIPVKSEQTFGKLASSINNIMDKFNYVIMEEKASEQTKIDLITSVSHDLRTPLTAILGYLQLVDDDKYEDEIKLRYYVNIALTKTKQLKVLIEDLFELTTLNNYGFKLDKTSINLVELINQLVIEYKLSFKRANIECRLFFPEDKIYISGDSIKIVRAFENIISNCIKYSNTSDFMDVIVKKEGEYARIDFINYGNPIPPSDLPYIFQRFYRVDKSRSVESGGSGLGLAISKNIIELHGGNIIAESNVQRTVFKVKLLLEKYKYI